MGESLQPICPLLFKFSLVHFFYFLWASTGFCSSLPQRQLLSSVSKFQNSILAILWWPTVIHFNIVFPLLIQTFEFAALSLVPNCHYKCICKFMQEEGVSCLKTLASPCCCDTLRIFYKLCTLLP